MSKIIEIFFKLIKSVVEKFMYNRKINKLAEKEQSIKDNIESIENKKQEVKKNISDAKKKVDEIRNTKVDTGVKDANKYVDEFIKRRRK